MASKVYTVAFPASTVTAPNTSNQYVPPLQGVYVGGAGNLKVLVKDRNGVKNAVTFNSIPAGSLLELTVYAVYSGNTTATGIIGMY